MAALSEIKLLAGEARQPVNEFGPLAVQQVRVWTPPRYPIREREADLFEPSEQDTHLAAPNATPQLAAIASFELDESRAVEYVARTVLPGYLVQCRTFVRRNKEQALPVLGSLSC